MKISLDSPVFKNGPFSAWLRIHKREFEIYLSVIVYIEPLLWYAFLGFEENKFDNKLNKLGITIININKEVAKETVKIAKAEYKKLPLNIMLVTIL